MRSRGIFVLGAAVVLVSGLALPAFAGNDSRATRPRVHRATLTGEAEVPGPGDADGTGSATVIVRPRSDQVCAVLRVRRIELPAVMAHIHVGAEDVAGPIVVNLEAPDHKGVSRICTRPDSDLVDDIAEHPEEYYVNVHTVDFPAGAVRGQLR